MADTATIRLTDMRFFGRVGHTEEERIVGTHIEVDIELVTGVEPSRLHDIDATLDYRRIHDHVKQVVTQGDHPLLEGLAHDILDELEALDWQQATVRVRKPRPPFEGHVGEAEVEMTRNSG